MQPLIHIFVNALRDARANFLHTLLSVLGIVIGVAALVSILSLIDGMENYARQQIEQTTSLNSITVQPQVNQRVNGISVRKTKIPVLTYEKAIELKSSLSATSSFLLHYQESGWLHEEDSSWSVGTLLNGLTEERHNRLEIKSGSFFSKEDLQNKRPVIVINEFLAHQIDSLSGKYPAIGDTLNYGGQKLIIQGLFKNLSPQPEILIPITAIDPNKLEERPPSLTIEASTVEDVPKLKTEIGNWLDAQYSPSDFRVQSNEFRVKQANQGFLVFRIVMGLIVGISVIVGGIGVMNVLLISVTERTREIGVRKAMGAKKKDIVLQFLAESLTISAIGSAMGLLFGVLFTMAAIPIIRSVTKMPFQAQYTLNTFLVIATVSVFIGIVFGTYPAQSTEPPQIIREAIAARRPGWSWREFS